MKRVFAVLALAAVLTAVAVTVQQQPRRADADNHCPAGCVETDGSTVIEPAIITAQTRGPWVVGKPQGTSQTVSVYATTGDRPAPGRQR